MDTSSPPRSPGPGLECEPVQNILLPSSSSGQDLFMRVLAGYDAPAFMKRARRVKEAHDDLLLAACRVREKMMSPVREALEEVLHLAGSWEVAEIHLRERGILSQLALIVRPRPYPKHSPVAVWRIRWALSDLVRAIERFNSAWADHLDAINLTEINALRDGYNRYYVLEKECVVRNAVLAATGFEPLPPLTLAHLHAQFPLLPVPRLT